VTALVVVLLLLAGDAGAPGAPDAGVHPSPLSPSSPSSRTAEDEEIIGNLDLLEHLADSEVLEMVLELGASPSGSDR
jgi:hypothetical protein